MMRRRTGTCWMARRLRSLGLALLGGVGLGAAPALLWNAANHLRHFSIDFGGYDRDGAVAPLLYGGAAVLTVVAIAAVVRL